MAVITPNTDLYLLKVPLEMDDINQLDFANKTAQYNYFSSLPKIGVDDFTYQRKDSTIRFPLQMDEIITYNYCMYRNTEYSDKWFYAFITKMEYVNDNMTTITIKTDVWQSWQFDLTYKAVLIDREHANTDVAGDNTLPEDLELGEMVANGSTVNFGGASNYCTVIEVTQVENDTAGGGTLTYEWDDNSTTRTVTPSLNGITRGTTPLVVGDFDSSSQTSVSAVIKAYVIAGLTDSIANVYMLPKSFITNYHTLSLTASMNGGSTYSVLRIVVPDATSEEMSLATQSFTKPTTLNGYTPKNKKMLTFPFCYFNLSNNAGNVQQFRYEDFPSSISFNVEATFGVSGSTKAIPQNYRGISSSDNALDYSLTGAKYPVCSWKSDSYTNWLTQNGVNMQIDEGMSVVRGLTSGVGAGAGMIMGAGLLGAPLTGGMTAMVAGATLSAMATPIISTAIEQYKAKRQANFMPDQVRGNTSAGDFLWAKYRSPYTFMPMSIKYEYALCADQFFSQFGYKCNKVKLPNIRGRRNWNYVKTVGCYIEADIPQDDLSEIKNMFDRGITIWHNPSTFMDYTQNNDII